MDSTDALISIQNIESHRGLWASCQSLLTPESLPQALLLLGPKHTHMLTFAYRWIASVFCQEVSSPCGQCRSCEMVKTGFHPDLVTLTKEEGASAIKIEQIRVLQETIYQTPSWQQFRFILLYPVDALNLAASNALLKLLEEPPPHVKFILISESYQVLPTLLSRCQRLYFNSAESFRQLHVSYMNIANHYPESSVRYQLKQEQGEFCAIIERLFSDEMNVCEAALRWQKIELDDFLWFFYLFIATCIAKTKFGLTEESSEFNIIQQLCRRFKQPMHLYTVLDKTLDFMATLKQNIALNHALVIESLLLSLVEAPDAYT